MPNIGPLELGIVLIVALLILGPKKLPEMGRSLGKGMREFKNSVSGNHDEEQHEHELVAAHAVETHAPEADAAVVAVERKTGVAPERTAAAA